MSGSPRLSSPSILLLAATLALGACIKSPAEPNIPSGVSAVSGSGQYANLNSAAPNPLVVLVVDPNGNPFPGATVSWKVTAGGGTVSDTSTTSDSTGHTSVTYTAGSRAGAATVVAVVEQVWTASFTIHLVAP